MSPGKLRVAEVASCELQVAYCESQRTAVEVSGEEVEGTWHFSRVHFLTNDLRRQTKMEASSEGNFSVSMNTSLSAPFQEERLGLGLYPRRGVTCKNSNEDARPYFWVWNLGRSWFFLEGGCRKLALLFRLRKATARSYGHRSTFHPRLQCNYQKLLRCHREENLQPGYTSTPCEGKICWQINCQYNYKGRLTNRFCNGKRFSCTFGGWGFYTRTFLKF